MPPDEWMRRARSSNFSARRDKARRKRLAKHLDTRNQERKEVQRQIVELAIAELESAARGSGKFLRGGDCRRGLASRRDWYCSLENC